MIYCYKKDTQYPKSARTASGASLKEKLSGGDVDELLDRSGRLSEDLVARLLRQAQQLKGSCQVQSDRVLR